MRSGTQRSTEAVKQSEAPRRMLRRRPSLLANNAMAKGTPRQNMIGPSFRKRSSVLSSVFKNVREAEGTLLHVIQRRLCRPEM